jgi:signal transduction histidine kinase
MLSLTFRPLFELDIVEGDERRIKQVIFNLLSNAMKFMPSGGFVDVSAVQMNGEVHALVSTPASMGASAAIADSTSASTPANLGEGAARPCNTRNIGVR